MTTPNPTIATDEQLADLANAVALQANALADMDPSAVEYYSKVRLIANNIDTLKAWTADRVPHPETANAVAAVEARDYLIYGSGQYAVRRQGPGVLIKQLATNETEWLQGDDADALEEKVDLYASDDRDDRDHFLSQWFGKD